MTFSKTLVGVVGSGMIGRDPWDGKCWSGSATPFFNECRKAGLLDDAFGVEAAPISRYALLAANFRPNVTRWRAKLNLDTGYYQALTQATRRHIKKTSDRLSQAAFLQIGAIYDLPGLLNGKTEVYSYNDGNLACMARSPFFDPALRAHTRKALEWEKRINQSLTKVFTMSEYLRRSFIEDYGVPADRVVSIDVGMNFPVPDEAALSKDYSRPNIVFIGVDFHRKGGPALVKAFNSLSAKHPTARLHIVGPKSLPKEIRDAGNPAIVFHGYLHRHDAAFKSLLMNGTLAVLPSLYEPFGIALLECMTYGMPGIATNRWAFPEVISQDENGQLVEPNDTEALADALDRYLSDPNLAAKHGKEARIRVLAKYGWDKVVANLARSLSSLN